MKYLLFIGLYAMLLIRNNFPQDIIMSQEPVAARKDSVAVISDEEIKKVMQFGVKEKVASIVMGTLWGGVIGCAIGGIVTSRKHSSEGEIGDFSGLVYGGAAGSIIGPIANYAIIYHLAKKDAKKRIIESRKREKSE